MAKKKQPAAKRNPFKYVRVKEPAAGLAHRAARARLKNLSQWVTEAVIEKLEREKLWPAAPPEADP